MSNSEPQGVIYEFTEHFCDDENEKHRKYSYQLVDIRDNQDLSEDSEYRDLLHLNINNRK